MRRPVVLVAVTMVALLVGCSSKAPEFKDASGAGPSASAEAGSPAVTASTSPSASAQPSPTTGGPCHGLPANNIWRAKVAGLPVHKSSAAFVAGIGGSATMHPDFGSGLWEGGPIGIPITTITGGQAKVSVTFKYSNESDKGPYPIPANAKIEGGPNSSGDRHIILHDPAGCRLYELFAAYPAGGGSWRAGSGAIFDMRSNKLRPAGWTSADASGLSIFAGLVRYEEVAAGRIDHAIRITAPHTRDAYIWPATHSASDLTDANLPPMGLRLRLKANVDISKFPAQARVVAEAMKTYGVIIADNGSPWFISGAPDNRWSNDALRALKQLQGNDFEAVDVSGIKVSSDSAAVR